MPISAAKRAFVSVASRVMLRRAHHESLKVNSKTWLIASKRETNWHLFACRERAPTEDVGPRRGD
jgi:hypothetical protein